MTNIKYIDFKRAETIIWTVGIGTVFFVVTYLNSTNKLFVWYTIIFGAIALLCSIFIAIRFIDVYYSFYEENNANWQPYGVYKKSIGQNSSIEKILDYMIIVAGGFLAGSSFCPQLWFPTASILYIFAGTRHYISLKRDDWKKGKEEREIENINSFLTDKYKFAYFYTILFFFGSIVVYFPNFVQHLLIIISNKPELYPIIFLLCCLLFVYILRLITEMKIKRKVNRILIWWKKQWNQSIKDQP